MFDEHAIVVRRDGGELERAVRLLRAPVELRAVDDDATDRGAVPTDPLGRRLDDDIRPKCQRLARVAAHPERVVDDQWQLVLFRNRCDCGEVGDRGGGIGDGLNIEGLCVLVYLSL